MLTACASSRPAGDDAPIAPDPVIEVRQQTVLVCPAELSNAPAGRPAPGDGAVVEYNAPGRDWIAAVIAWGEGLALLLTDARAACPPANVAANVAGAVTR